MHLGHLCFKEALGVSVPGRMLLIYVSVSCLSCLSVCLCVIVHLCVYVLSITQLSVWVVSLGSLEKREEGTLC